MSLCSFNLEFIMQAYHSRYDHRRTMHDTSIPLSLYLECHTQQKRSIRKRTVPPTNDHNDTRTDPIRTTNGPADTRLPGRDIAQIIAQ